MRIGVWIILVLIIIVGALFLFLPSTSEAPHDVTHLTNEVSMSDLALTSTVFSDGKAIPSKYTCDGEDINPPLTISGVPEDAQSLVLIMDDPDAVKPAGKVWDHWVVFNIPTTVTDIAEATEPEGVAGNNSWPRLGYGGPCPPDGEHHYMFKLYALDTELTLAEGATKSEVEQAMRGHIIANTQLVGTYNRS